ncbi:DEHA2D15906p [Debaryomyces hansenii CBS767]|uniref:DEHA2D15906p n=1 Tax=Debaryomyces hansenii (strain ATCC 36239 / CBS 767 / BCRC 21394 / JCM 1990 / NBRC 0083 / IGC 2968) TaxID=284592 RepID=Q6BRJ5_DEBHA|nr:DEHA2D15906p [Debaryomyces hansenii CBS767]CAG87346.1 DEHA2D15906p [Debaryomyces hansenii CBS767]|eukprot:XP_459175.1 DEHA2D15906p [Debaryomyces hansenii CBS767]
MITSRVIRTLPGNARLFAPVLGFHSSFINRAYSTKVEKKKKTQQADISQIPIKSIGIIADFYVPPKYLKSPVTSWHKLLFRRMGLFAINTYSIVKFKRETGLKLHFNQWKDTAVEQLVKTNKIFAASCSISNAKREKYLKSQLEGVTGAEVTKSLIRRASTFPPNSKLDWELLKIESNPKIISFNALPDADNITALVQFVIQVKTKQKFTITTINSKPQVTESSVENYLAYTLNPFTNEMALVGSLFESDHLRGVQPEINFTNSQVMASFQVSCADIFRAAPKKQIEAKKN